MLSSSSISLAEFKEVLTRYPALIEQIADTQAAADLTLTQLDQFRYIDAPAAFSKGTGRTLKLADVEKLVQWKLRHGKYRPSLSKLVSTNDDEKVAAATKEAFDHHANNPAELVATIKLLADPLKGIGPATASLLLSIHDPENVVFFSDEAYTWLVKNGTKSKLVYSFKEYDALSTKAKAFMEKLKVTPQDVEKVAFVLIKENDPVSKPAGKYVPTGLPRGRPAKSEAEKMANKKVPSGLPRGPRAKPASEKPATSGRGRGRPAKPKSDAEPTADDGALKKKRGRPAGVKRKAEDDAESTTPQGAKKAKA